MADNLDPNLLRELNENFSLLNSSTGYQNKEFDSLTSSTRSLNTEFIKLIGITNSDLAKSLSQFNKNLDKSSKDTEKADKFAQTDLEKKKKQSKELETEHTRNLTYYKSLSGYATSLEGFVNQTSSALTKAAGNGLVFSTALESGSIYLNNLRKVYEATIDAQNAYTRSLIGGQRGFVLQARYNEQVGKAANDLQRQLGGLAIQVGSLAAFLTIVSKVNPVFKALGIAAGAVAAMFGYNEQMAAKAADAALELATAQSELRDRITSTMYDLGAASVIGIEGITGFKKDLAKLTLPFSDMAKFSAVLRNNVSELAIIGPTAAEGGRKLAEISGKLIESDLGKQFEYMGITVEKQTEHTLKYLSLQQRLGFAQEKDTTKLSMAAGKYLVELEKIAVLTGATREEQEKARDQVMAIEELRAAMLAEEDIEKKKQLARAVQASEALFAAGAKDAGAAIAKMAAAGGAITSQESAKLQMAAPKFVDDILNGKGPVTVALKGFAGEVQEFQKQFAGTGRLSYEAIKDILIMGFKDAADLKIKVDNSYAAAEKLAREKNYTLDKALFEIRKTQDEETKKAIDLERKLRQEAIARQESLVVAQGNVMNMFGESTNMLKKAGEYFGVDVTKFGQAVQDFLGINKNKDTPKSHEQIVAEEKLDIKKLAVEQKTDRATKSSQEEDNVKKDYYDFVKKGMVEEATKKKAELNKLTEIRQKDEMEVMAGIKDAFQADLERKNAKRKANQKANMEEDKLNQDHAIALAGVLAEEAKVKLQTEKLSDLIGKKVELEKDLEKSTGKAKVQIQEQLKVNKDSIDVAKKELEVQQEALKISTEKKNEFQKALKDFTDKKNDVQQSGQGQSNFLQNLASFFGFGAGASTPAKDILSKLKLKSSEATSGGESSSALLQLAEKIQELYPNATFTALNDLYHQKNAPDSAHVKGKALDFSLGFKPTAEEGNNIIEKIKKLGAIKVLDEYNKPSKNSTGGHIHVEVAHDGGYFKGPVGSEFPVLLKSNETVLTEQMVKSLREKLNQVQKQSVSTIIPELNQTREGNVVPNNSLSKNIQQLTDTIKNIPIFYDNKLTQGTKDIEPLFKSIENNVVPNIFDPIIKSFGIKTTELKQVDQEKEKTPITQQVIPSTNVTSNDSVVKDLISMLIKQQEQTMEKYNTMVELLESSARSQDQLLKYSM